MLEELCRTAMHDLCNEVVKSDRLAKIKGDTKKRQFADFFYSPYDTFQWKTIPLMQAMNARKATTIRRSWVWFNENAEQICSAYIRKEYGGNIERAMLLNESFCDLFNEFKGYFEDRRKKQVEKIEMAVAERKQELAKINKLPQSHGGVANLLKVLTKTMHEQGSSIHTVAKVQYAICVQAGIYIPDEFLTDVLTAVDVMEG